MNATKRPTPKPERAGKHLAVPQGDSSLGLLAFRAGAMWLMTTIDEKSIIRARSYLGEEWAARGR